MLNVFRESQNKTTMRYCHVPTKMAKIKHADIIRYWNLYSCITGCSKIVQSCWKSILERHKVKHICPMTQQF